MSSVTDLVNSTEAAGTWALDQNRSSFTFKNKTMWGLMTVKGHFTEYSGDGNLDAGGKVSGRIAIKAASVKTGIKRRDNHLRSADFFDAENYPDITVTVSGIDPADGDGLNVRADMSIRGNTVAVPMGVRAEALGEGAVRLTTTTTLCANNWASAATCSGCSARPPRSRPTRCSVAPTGSRFRWSGMAIAPGPTALTVLVWTAPTKACAKWSLRQVRCATTTPVKVLRCCSCTAPDRESPGGATSVVCCRRSPRTSAASSSNSPVSV